MDRKITFNGKSYASIGEMPADIREKFQRMLSTFADKNLNGIPDILEGESGEVHLISKSKIFINGKEYSSLNGLPKFARRAFDKVIDLQPGDASKSFRNRRPHWINPAEPLHLHNDPRIKDQIPITDSAHTTSNSSRFFIILLVTAGIAFISLILFVFIFAS